VPLDTPLPLPAKYVYEYNELESLFIRNCGPAVLSPNDSRTKRKSVYEELIELKVIDAAELLKVVVAIGSYVAGIYAPTFFA
jgi:hypothetical protein